MTAVDLDQIEAGLKALSGIDAPGALAAFRTANVQGELQTLEQVAAVVAVFFPPAEYIKDALIAVALIERGRELGLWAPDSGTSAADLARDAHDHRSGGR